MELSDLVTIIALAAAGLALVGLGREWQEQRRARAALRGLATRRDAVIRGSPPDVAALRGLVLERAGAVQLADYAGDPDARGRVESVLRSLGDDLEWRAGLDDKHPANLLRVAEEAIAASDVRGAMLLVRLHVGLVLRRATADRSAAEDAREILAGIREQDPSAQEAISAVSEALDTVDLALEGKAVDPEHAQGAVDYAGRGLAELGRRGRL